MIELRPLDDLDPDVVQAVVTETAQRVAEDNPNLEVRRGVVAELLVHYHAVLDTQRRANIQDYLNARSLLAIQADPTLADPDLVDDVLSNFRLTRQPGRLAAGEVTVVVSDDVTVTIPQGSVWEAQGRQYTTPRVFTAKLEEAQVILIGDRLLRQTQDGNWAFTIDVEAVEEGPEYAVRKDTLVVPVSVPPNYVSSYAAGDFSAGLATESNEDLLARMQEGISAKALSNRGNMAAALRDVEAFSRVVDMSIVGHGDGELVRAFHSILPIALPGRCDWYVRTQESVTRVNLSVSATLVEKLDDGTGVWQFGVGRDDAPGFYEFSEIRPADFGEAAGGYEVTSDVRGLDVTGAGFKPDVTTAAEAAFSAYSTAVVQFVDTRDHGDLTVGDRQTYDVAAVCLPLISDIQAHVNSRDVRPYGGDCLVKAPVPCFVSLNLTIHKRAGQDDPDVDAIKTDLCRVVNQIGFVGVLYASQLHDVIHDRLLERQTVGGIDMFGRIRYPDGTKPFGYVRSSEVLTVPDEPGEMVTARTVQFFCDPGDIGVTVATTIPSGE